MIGQSMINVSNGGRGRLSTFVAGAFLLVLILVLQPLLVQIPMAALVAVMIVVSVGTFDWESLRTLPWSFPKAKRMVMLATVAVTVLTHDLSLGVLVGVVLSALFFARKISQALRGECTATPRTAAAPTRCAASCSSSAPTTSPTSLTTPRRSAGWSLT